MGTKPRSKGATSGDGDDPRQVKAKKKPWIVRMIRKRKYKSLSEENLNDIAKDTTKEPDRAAVMEMDSAYRKQDSAEDDDIVVETMSQLDGEDHRGDGEDRKDSRKKSSDGGKYKFGSAFKFLKKSFKHKKRKKQADYAKFAEFADDLAGADVHGHEKEDEMEHVHSDEDEELAAEQLGTNHKYVRFDSSVEDKENMATTIDDETTATPKKKKKSAKKRVAKVTINYSPFIATIFIAKRGRGIFVSSLTSLTIKCCYSRIF